MLKIRLKIARMLLPEQIAIVHRGLMREGMDCVAADKVRKAVIEDIEYQTMQENF